MEAFSNSSCSLWLDTTFSFFVSFYAASQIVTFSKGFPPPPPWASRENIGRPGSIEFHDWIDILFLKKQVVSFHFHLTF